MSLKTRRPCSFLESLITAVCLAFSETSGALINVFYGRFVFCVSLPCVCGNVTLDACLFLRIGFLFDNFREFLGFSMRNYKETRLLCVFFLKSVSISVSLREYRLSFLHAFESLAFGICNYYSRLLCASFPRSVGLACFLRRSWYFVCRFPSVPWFMFLPEIEDLCVRF